MKTAPFTGQPCRYQAVLLTRHSPKNIVPVCHTGCSKFFRVAGSSQLATHCMSCHCSMEEHSSVYRYYTSQMLYWTHLGPKTVRTTRHEHTDDEGSDELSRRASFKLCHDALETMRCTVAVPSVDLEAPSDDGRRGSLWEKDAARERKGPQAVHSGCQPTRRDYFYSRKTSNEAIYICKCTTNLHSIARISLHLKFH